MQACCEQPAGHEWVGFHEGAGRFRIRRLENHDRRPYAVLAAAGHDEGLVEKRSLEVAKWAPAIRSSFSVHASGSVDSSGRGPGKN